MENGPFEDVFPIKHRDIPASYVSLPEGSATKKERQKIDLCRVAHPESCLRFLGVAGEKTTS